MYLLNQFLLKTYVDQECVTLIDRSCSCGGNVCILLSTSSVMPHEEDSHSVWFCRPLLCSIGLGVIELNITVDLWLGYLPKDSNYLWVQFNVFQILSTVQILLHISKNISPEMVSSCSGYHIIMHSNPISEVYPIQPLIKFQCWSNKQWSCLIIPRQIAHCNLFLCLCPQGNWWWDTLACDAHR